MVESTILPSYRVTVVGVLNLTPDSFSDGGRFVGPGERVDVEAALEAGHALAAAGAHVIDVGGESTRPGARPVPAALEIARIRPVIEGLAKASEIPVSVDTRKAEVAEAALEAGARIVNDVSGLSHDPALATVAARFDAGLILGHLRGEPATMQRCVHFEDVLEEVAAELRASADRARGAGIPDERLGVDPGLGFGKQLPHNLTLLASGAELRQRTGLPVLVGPSRKSFLGEQSGDPLEARGDATLAACSVAVYAGADGVRVHDVAAARRATRLARALRDTRGDRA
ncbi:MAG: dihydropteroate synthase [Myxococcota bacterium]